MHITTFSSPLSPLFQAVHHQLKAKARIYFDTREAALKSRRMNGYDWTTDPSSE